MAKSKTSYTKLNKNATTFVKSTKNATTYNRTNSNLTSILLNDTVVQLNSTVYLLSGYTGATPNQLSNKNATTFTAV